MRLELAAITQQESENVEDFVCRLRSKAKSCSFTQDQKDDHITFQLIKGIKWPEARRKLIGKGNNLTLDDAIKLAQDFQATLANMSVFENNSIGAVRRHNNMGKNTQRNECQYCGTKHPPRKCPAYGKKCAKCKRFNHYEKMCKSGKFNKQESRSKADDDKEATDAGKNVATCTLTTDEQTLDCGSIMLCATSKSTDSNDERQSIMVKLDVRPPNIKQKVTLKVKADTGANGNVLPTRCLRQMYPNVSKHQALLKPTCTRLTAVNDTNIHTYGTIQMPVKLDNSEWIELLFYVCDTQGPAILSCDATERLGIISVSESRNVSVADAKPTSTQITDIDALEKMFPDRFEGLGNMPRSYRIELKPDAIPHISPPRKYPIKLRDEIISKIQEMEKMGVVKRCNDDEASEWIHSLAFTRKSNGELRVCLDPRKLNACIKRTYHKIPTIEEISHKLSEATIFPNWMLSMGTGVSILTSTAVGCAHSNLLRASTDL